MSAERPSPHGRRGLSKDGEDEGEKAVVREGEKPQTELFLKKVIGLSLRPWGGRET